MPGPEEIPDVPAFVVLRVVVGRWSPALPPIVEDSGTQLLGEPATDLAGGAAELLM
jgi:hypothetical protein